MKKLEWQGWVALVALALLAAPSAAAEGPGLLDLLRPGSRPSLGLGGDPFLSPLADQSGWWSALELGEPPAARAQYGAGAPLGGAAGGRLHDQELSWSAGVAGRLGRSPWRATARLRHPRLSGEWDGSVGGLRVDGSARSVELGLRAEPAPGLVAQAVNPLWTEGVDRSLSGPGIGVRYRPGRRAALQGSWERTRVPETLRSDLMNEPIAASLNLGLERYRVEGRLGPIAGLAVEGSLARANVRGIRGRSPLLAYQIEPHGVSATDQASLRWQATGSGAMLFRWTRLDADLGGDFSWGGLRFGQLNYGRARLESCLLALESRAPRTRALLEAERLQISATARGEIESWPFTSTITDFLGLRRIYRAKARADGWRGHLGVERALGSAGRARAGAEWIDLFPNASWESWRPAFLVFGRTDERVDHLDVTRLQLAVASLGWTQRFGPLEGELGVEQVVLARASKDHGGGEIGSVGANSAPGSGAGPGEDDTSRRWPGGTRLRVALIHRL